MGEHNPRSPTLDLTHFFKVPKAKSLKEVTKVYKSIVYKRHNDKKNSEEATSEAGYMHINDKSLDEDIWSNPKILSRSGSRRSKTPSPTTKRSMSKQPSRRCTTPTPVSRSESRKETVSSSSSSSSLKRILSRRGGSASFSRRSMSTLEISAPELLPAPAASPPTKDHVHEIISKSSDKETEKIPSVSLSSNLSRRATTPIIFSQTTARRKPPEVEKKLFCSLEDLCFGCTKKIKVTRDVIKYPGVILQEEEILKIEIQPGWRKGTKITFEGKGDEKPGFLPGDIVFVIDEKKHPLYTRNGNNLEIGVEIPLADALTGCSIPIPLLGGKNMTLLLDNIVIYHGYEKVIEGQGMPIPKSKGTRGDLLVKFLIHFPTHLSDEQRQEAFCILQECC
ncbi:PREDICTED: uncharacterized protein LOC109329247 [Lupinus angustifolius]|uniref:uncharacterized protein LOC109329247 n=1 Tax=Lupinus angustifolius TaxID=3871 RepID=UPI00092F0EB0|nr:PREDICTED: uncharacterized protein LOC109329247 [Lupinus angustifolius]